MSAIRRCYQKRNYVFISAVATQLQSNKNLFKATTAELCVGFDGNGNAKFAYAEISAVAKEKKRKMNEKLEYWKKKYAASLEAYAPELAKMQKREELWTGEYNAGNHNVRNVGNPAANATHLRNIVSELIESQLDGVIPQPIVTARRDSDAHLASRIEAMLRGELDRLPMERINDMLSRTVLLQGGGYLLVEWDSTQSDDISRGEVTVTPLHPMRVIPQDGVFSDVNDMDYVFVRLPESPEKIYSRFGVTVDTGDIALSKSDYEYSDCGEDMAVRIAVYYKSSSGIGFFSWVGDTVLCDMPDYESRCLYRCTVCGRVSHGETCHVCGGRTAFGGEKFEELKKDVGKIKKGTLAPYYRPGKYPLILQKNVSVWGRLLGESDCDRIADQQYTTNALEAKIRDKLFSGGSFITLPDDASVEVTGEDMRVIRLSSPADKALIDTYTLQGDIGNDLKYLAQVYEEARQIIGMTDAYQGREDSTAQSGTAKQFSAQMTLGRFKSKKVMKRAAYSALFELIFRLRLAYCDEPLPLRKAYTANSDTNGSVAIPETDLQCNENSFKATTAELCVGFEGNGNAKFAAENETAVATDVESVFSRYDFLTGEGDILHYNDAFLFSCDVDEPLALDRERLWEQTARAYEMGAFGEVGSDGAREKYWHRLARQNYPGAVDTSDGTLLQ